MLYYTNNETHAANREVREVASMLLTPSFPFYARSVWSMPWARETLLAYLFDQVKVYCLSGAPKSRKVYAKLYETHPYCTGSKCNKCTSLNRSWSFLHFWAAQEVGGQELYARNVDEEPRAHGRRHTLQRL